MRLRNYLKKIGKLFGNERGSWVATAIALTAVSASVSAYGSYASGQAQQKLANYNADVANQNALLTQRTADTNISLVQSQAAEQSKIQGRNVTLLKGSQAAMEAAQGIGGGSVTSADILSSTMDTAELDKQAIRYNADTKAWAIKNNANFEAWNYGNQSKQYSMAGANAATAGGIGAATSLLSGASSIASQSLMNKYYMNRGQSIT